MSQSYDQHKNGAVMRFSHRGDVVRFTCVCSSGNRRKFVDTFRVTDSG